MQCVPKIILYQNHYMSEHTVLQIKKSFSVSFMNEYVSIIVLLKFPQQPTQHFLKTRWRLKKVQFATLAVVDCTRRKLLHKNSSHLKHNAVDRFNCDSVHWHGGWMDSNVTSEFRDRDCICAAKLQTLYTGIVSSTTWDRADFLTGFYSEINSVGHNI